MHARTIFKRKNLVSTPEASAMNACLPNLLFPGSMQQNKVAFQNKHVGSYLSMRLVTGWYR